MLLTPSSLTQGIGTGNIVSGGAITALPNIIQSTPQTTQTLNNANTFTSPTQPTQIVANGIIYYAPGTPNATPQNTFNYNPSTGAITLPVPLTGVAIIQTQILPSVVLGLTGMVVDDFKLKRSMGGQPECSFTLVVPRPIYDQTLAAYRPGSRLTISGIPFAIASVNITHGTVSETGRVSLFNVECIGQWSQHLTPQPYNQSTSRNPSVTSLQQIASYGGATLLFPLAPVVVPRRSPVGETYDWASTLDGHALYNRSVVYWSNGAGISLKRVGWDVPTRWSFGETDILGGVTINYPQPYLWQSQRNNTIQMGDANLSSVVNGVPILPDTGVEQLAAYGEPVFRFTNTQLTGDYAVSDAQYIDYTFLTALGQSTSFVPRQRVRLTKVNGDSTLPSWASGSVKTLSASSDITGFTKTVTISTTIDDQPESESITVYGFSIPSNGVGNSASSYWGVIEQSSKSYAYGNYGYLLGYKVSGFKRLRFETPDPTKNNADNAANTTKYTYSNVPVSGWGNYSLEPISKYYYEEPGNGVIIDASGNVISDPTYVPEYFVKSEERQEFGIEVAPNPTQGQPQLTKGREYVYNKRVNIDNPGNLQNVSGFITQAAIAESQKQERYTEYWEEHSSDGAAFDAVLSNSGYDEFAGRPGKAPSLPPLYEAQDTVAEQLELTQPISRLYQAITIRDSDYNGSSVGSVNYSEARTVEDARISAETDWLLKNTTQGMQVTFTLPGAIAIEEGDKIRLSVNGKVYIGYALSVSIDGKVHEQVRHELFNTTITLGVEPPRPTLAFNFIPKDQVFNFVNNNGSFGFSASSITSTRLK
jgi:hypothetical protein